MKRLLLFLLPLLIPPAQLAGQTLSRPGSSGRGVTITTVAGLASVPGKVKGTIASVTDGNSATDCTTGTGATAVACQYNGTSWAAIGRGGSISPVCVAVGSAGNPSVVACSAAPIGSFSCDPAATGGICQVNTSAVTANSRIFVQPSSAESANLSVTCNLGSDINLALPRLLSKTASTGFSINLGTFATNPLCFSYWIVN